MMGLGEGERGKLGRDGDCGFLVDNGLILTDIHFPTEPTDEDSVIAGITVEDFDSLSASFSSRRPGSMAAQYSSLNASCRSHGDGNVFTFDMKQESQEDLLRSPDGSQQSLPQLVNVQFSVKKVSIVKPVNSNPVK
jgi:hypothetical protein